MRKYFIITVDTEGDNGWSWHRGDKITTQNANFVKPFQELCDKFNFKPVYLTNYEMACDNEFLSMLAEWEKDGRCEIGIHLHAWNNPPDYELNSQFSGQDYLIEYPEEIMREKFSNLYNLLVERVGHPIYSHRAGRWAMDNRYFKILSEYEIKVDCSFTPGINWVTSLGQSRGGSDYSNVGRNPMFIGNILEIPVTIRDVRAVGKGRLKHKMKTLLIPHKVWCRPSMYSLNEIKRMVDIVYNDTSTDYIQFMIHSSELMAGGSPYFRTSKDVEKLYKTLITLFEYISEKGYLGCTLYEYYNNFSCKK